MGRSLLKYFQETGGPGTEHRGHLHWPGTAEGFPYRGDVIPDLKKEEAAEMPHVLDYKSRLFKLWEPIDKRDFDEINDKIANGWYGKINRRDEWNAEHQHLIVWLEWVQIYGEAANTKSPGRTADVSAEINLRIAGSDSRPEVPPPNLDIDV